MPFERKTHFERIKKILNFVRIEVTTAGQLNLTDVHIYAENFYRDFLNLLYDWKLTNINEEERNATAIDLGDRQLRKAIQVTSDNSLGKIRTTVHKFIDKEWHKDFDELIFVRIGNPRKHKKKTIGVKDTFEVKTPDCVVDVDDLLEKIQGFSETKLNEVKKFLEREVSLPETVIKAPSNKYIDIEIVKQLTIIRQFRFFNGSNTVDKCKRLVEQIETGELSSCSQLTKDKAFGWCARFLASSDLELSQKLIAKISSADLDEIKISEAFVLSRSSNTKFALSHLPSRNTKELNSARLFIGTQEFLTASANDWLGAFQWVAKSGFSIVDFCSDGKGRYLQICLHNGKWKTALESLTGISELDYSLSPLLNYLVGTAYLAVTIPEEFRQQILYNPPIYLKSFPIITNEENLSYLNQAALRFSQSCTVAAEQNLTVSASISDQFALWVMLRNPRTFEEGIERLKSRLRLSESNFGFINFAYEFDLPIDSELVEERITQSDTKGIDLGFDGAIARFTLARLKPPREAVEYLLLHRKDLIRQVPVLFVNSILIELFCRFGRVSEAAKLLTELEDLNVSQEELNRLSNSIEKAGEDPVEILIQDYHDHGSTDTLLNLCRMLENCQDWSRLHKYSEQLFINVKTVATMEWVATSLHNLGNLSETYLFLSENQDLIEQSNILQKLWVSAIYSTGDLAKAKTIADELLNLFQGDPFLEELRIQIAITSGNWSWLSQYLWREWQGRAGSPAQKLMNLAKLSQSIKFDKTKEFVAAATEQDSANSQTFLDAFMLASNGGWEEDEFVGSWLGKAIDLSGEDGPVQKFSLDELIDLNPGWNEHRRDTYKQLKESRIPSFVAAKNLNSGLFSFVVLEALCNREIAEIRRKSIIRAYSPKRASYDISATSVAIDATAILTFGLLGLLSSLEEVFERIYIPHSMLRWLFEEKQKLEFNQANQAVRAELLTKLVSNDKLTVLTESKCDNELSLKVGTDLASLLIAAQSDAKGDRLQHVAVPNKVYHVASLMKDLVDLEDFENVCCSCIDLIQYLDISGLITSEEKSRAINFLSGQSELTEFSVEIQSEATLYLSPLSLSYLESMKLLEKLCYSDLDVVLSKSDYERARGINKYQRFLGQALIVLEDIRKYLELGIESEFVKVGHQHQHQHQSKEVDTNVLMEHPSITIADLSGLADAFVVDDPFLNQHRQFTGRDNDVTPIFSSLDIIKHIGKLGRIDKYKESQLKTDLRKFGFTAIVPDQVEIEEQLFRAIIRDGKIIQSAELKALRDSFTHMQMTSALNMPEEYVYLANLFKAARGVITSIWVSTNTNSDKEIRSNWLIDLIDLKGWSTCYSYELGSSVARNSSLSFTRILISNGAAITELKQRLAYFDWLDRRCIQPIKGEKPALYKQIVEETENEIEKMMNTPIEEMMNDNS